MKNQSKVCKKCKKFNALYLKKGLCFKKMHLGVCVVHNHIRDENNTCQFWCGKKD